MAEEDFNKHFISFFQSQNKRPVLYKKMESEFKKYIEEGDADAYQKALTEVTNQFSIISKEIISLSQIFQQTEPYHHVYKLIRMIQDLEKENLGLVSENMVLRLKLKDCEENDEDYQTFEIQRQIDLNIKKHQVVLNNINDTLEEIRHEQITIYENRFS